MSKQYWDPHTILDVYPNSPGFKCVGKALTTREQRQCGNSIKPSDQSEAEHILRTLAATPLIHNHRPLLNQLASVTLCARWHRERKSQVPDMVGTWGRRISVEINRQERVRKERTEIGKSERSMRERVVKVERSVREEKHELDRVEQERVEHQRIERREMERERLERQRVEQERVEHERIEEQRIERERIERERIERQRIKKETIERMMAEAEKAVLDRLEREKIAKKRAIELERLKVAQEELVRERTERERTAKEREAKLERLEAELVINRAEHPRIEKEEVGREDLKQETIATPVEETQRPPPIEEPAASISVKNFEVKPTLQAAKPSEPPKFDFSSLAQSNSHFDFSGIFSAAPLKKPGLRTTSTSTSHLEKLVGQVDFTTLAQRNSEFTFHADAWEDPFLAKPGEAPGPRANIFRSATTTSTTRTTEVQTEKETLTTTERTESNSAIFATTKEENEKDRDTETIIPDSPLFDEKTGRPCRGNPKEIKTTTKERQTIIPLFAIPTADRKIETRPLETPPVQVHRGTQFETPLPSFSKELSEGEATPTKTGTEGKIKIRLPETPPAQVHRGTQIKTPLPSPSQVSNLAKIGKGREIKVKLPPASAYLPASTGLITPPDSASPKVVQSFEIKRKPVAISGPSDLPTPPDSMASSQSPLLTSSQPEVTPTKSNPTSFSVRPGMLTPHDSAFSSRSLFPTSKYAESRFSKSNAEGFPVRSGLLTPPDSTESSRSSRPEPSTPSPPSSKPEGITPSPNITSPPPAITSLNIFSSLDVTTNINLSLKPLSSSPTPQITLLPKTPSPPEKCPLKLETAQVQVQIQPLQAPTRLHISRATHCRGKCGGSFHGGWKEIWRGEESVKGWQKMRCWFWFLVDGGRKRVSLKKGTVDVGDGEMV